ncbi:MAG: hypothetical protein V7K50_21455 [Nostoc sp.]|uniref:hypothetical protein n=1 Tax=Nostoc sp. TaxID=1180 RepID=UPI002FFB8C3F
MLYQIQDLEHSLSTSHAHSIGDRLTNKLQNFSPTSPALLVTFNTRFLLLYRIYCAVS